MQFVKILYMKSIMRKVSEWEWVSNKVKFTTLIMFLLSILMIYPLYFLSLSIIGNLDNVGWKSPAIMHHPDSITNSFSYNTYENICTSVEYQFAYFFLIADGLSIIAIAVYFFHKISCDNFLTKTYIFLSAFLGFGFFLFPVANKKIKPVKISVNFRKITYISLIFSLMIISFSMLIFSGYTANINYKSSKINGKIALSTKSDQKNLIIFCVDSLDNHWTMPYFLNDKYKDFLYFPYFITPGFYTSESEKAIYSGTIENDLWPRIQNGEVFKYTAPLYESLPEKKLEFILDLGFNNISLVNEYFSKGDFAKEYDKSPLLLTGKKFNGVGSTFSKYENSTLGLFNNNIPEKNMMLSASNNLSISSDAGVVFSTLNSLHNPYFGDEDGDFSIFKGNSTWISSEMRNYNSAASFVSKYIAEFLDALKLKSDKYGNLYDNSMIVIFGDHSSHSNIPPSNEADAGAKTLKNQSALLIKYPNTNLVEDSPTVMDESAIYGPFLFKIIQHYFRNNGTFESEKEWITKNSNFRIDRSFITFKPYWQFSGAYLSHLNENGDVVLQNTFNGTPSYYFTNDTEKINQQVEEVGWIDEKNINI